MALSPRRKMEDSAIDTRPERPYFYRFKATAARPGEGRQGRPEKKKSTMEKLKRQKPRQAADHPGRIRHALVIDDVEADRFVADALIRRMAPLAVVHGCRSAGEALGYLQGLDAGRFPDLIVLDMHLPGQDGLGFLEKLSELPHFDSTRCRLLPVSAYMEFYREKSRIDKLRAFPHAAPCRPKPLTQAILNEIVQR